MSYPFVVSGDVQLLLGPWAEANGFKLPSKQYFKEMADELCRNLSRIFPKVDYLDGEELSGGLGELLSRYGGVSIFLDRAYTSTDIALAQVTPHFTLDMSRYVNARNMDVGIRSRKDSESLLQQLRRVPQGKIALVDDVIFTGELLERVIKTLSHRGTRVTHVFAGVGVGNGTARIRKMGVEVACVREYLSVIDEVCERDFYPGVPYSGRSLVGAPNTGVPYLLPWGNPEQWASIPASHHRFSDFCIQATIGMYREIERLSGDHITFDKLGRQFPKLGYEGKHVVSLLEDLLSDRYEVGILCH